MVKLHLTLDGDADAVARALRRICGASLVDGREPSGVGVVSPNSGAPGAAAAVEMETQTSPGELRTGRWTQELAANFVAGLSSVARRVIRYIWRAGDVRIHRRELCQRAELTPEELRGLLVSVAHGMRRIQRERGTALSRPVVANRPLQGYCIDVDFAAAAKSGVFGDEE